MLIEILKRTPPWVFVLFFVLLVYGYSQSKNRTVSRYRIAILPAAMIVLSFYGMLSAFGIVPVGLASWVIGVGVSVWLGLVLAVPRGVTYSNETQSFFFPGAGYHCP
jgi:heme A synthase